MDFLEKDLETILYTSPQEKVKQLGLRTFDYDKIYKQVQLGNYGIADLITIKRFDRLFAITVYELKNKTVNAATFWQTLRYMKALEHFIGETTMTNRFIICGAIVGRYLDLSGEVAYLPDFVQNLNIYTYDYGLDGMKFERQSGCHLRNPGEINFEKQGFSSAKDFLTYLAMETQPIPDEIQF